MPQEKLYIRVIPVTAAQLQDVLLKFLPEDRRQFYENMTCSECNSAMDSDQDNYLFSYTNTKLLIVFNSIIMGPNSLSTSVLPRAIHA